MTEDKSETNASLEILHLFEHIVSSSTDMMAHLDTSFRYLAANKAYVAAFKKTQEEIVGQTAPEVFGEEFFNAIIRPHAERCLEGEVVTYESWFNFPAYEPRYMEINYYPYTGLSGKVEGFVVNGRNITDRKTPLEQVFRNLIGNAIKHHDRSDGCVHVSARRQGPFLEFTVADDGPGIQSEFHERIFRMFQALQRRDDVEGTGVGLAVVKKVVESQGGAIRVESADGKGAVFRFTWPRRVQTKDYPMES